MQKNLKCATLFARKVAKVAKNNSHNISVNQKDKHHYDYTLQKQRHEAPISPLQMNLKLGTTPQKDKDTAWDLALRAWTTEHQLGG